MKKILLLLVLLGTMAISSCSDPNQYDTENYIGPADIPSYYTEEFDIIREDMSTFIIEADTAKMIGYISADTIRQVETLTTNYPDVKTIQMVDVGGSLDDESNLIACRMVREAGIATYLAADGHVASGGTDFFCAGITRTAEEGAQIGVHSWADDTITNAALLPIDDPNHQTYIDYYTEMNLPDPEGFYFFTIRAAEAEGMHYMSREELIAYGLTEE